MCCEYIYDNFIQLNLSLDKCVIYVSKKVSKEGWILNKLLINKNYVRKFCNEC